MDHPAFQEIIASTQLMTLATVDEQGPWAATVFFMWHQGQFYFVSSKRSRHIQAATYNPVVAATIQPEPDNWGAICGLQLSGTQREVVGAERLAIMARYLSHYPFVAAHAVLREKLNQNGCYAITPETLTLIDNRNGFAQRQTLI